MKIQDNRYTIEYHAETCTITCQGVLRLYGGTGYASIADLLYSVADQKPEKVVLDIRELSFLNSSGINVFYKFILRVRDYHATRIKVLGTDTIFWQPKLIINFRRLIPDIQVQWTRQ